MKYFQLIQNSISIVSSIINNQLDFQPLSIVRSPPFLQLLKSLDLNYYLTVSLAEWLYLHALWMKRRYLRLKIAWVKQITSHNQLIYKVDVTINHTYRFKILNLQNLKKHYHLQIQEITKTHTAVILAEDLRSRLEQWETPGQVIMIYNNDYFVNASLLALYPGLFYSKILLNKMYLLFFLLANEVAYLILRVV